MKITPEQFNAEYKLEERFLKESVKEYIPVSDNQRIYCLYSKKKGNFKKETIVFIQGFGSGKETWSDLWDEMYKEFDLLVIDPRDKETIKLDKKAECSVPRIARDIIEIVKYYQVAEEKIIFFGSSVGATYISHAISQEWIKPFCCFFAAPAIKPRTPGFLISLASLLPNKLVNSIARFIGRIYLKNKVAEGFQKKVYLQRVETVDVAKWKQCNPVRKWSAAEDFRALNLPVYLILTIGDKYHRYEESKLISQMIKGSHVLEVPSYEYFHLQPGVKEFVQQFKKIINNLLQSD